MWQLSVKLARKQEAARRARRSKVMGRVAESHEPFPVKIGVRSWNAKRVPVGRRLAKLAVPVKVCEIARCESDGGGGCCFGVSGKVSSGTVEVVVVAMVSDKGVCLEGVGLALRDIFGIWGCGSGKILARNGGGGGGGILQISYESIGVVVGRLLRKKVSFL
ncbi:unnamed protein product [Ilex paraguariensis]|uniref:Uncharacterized protein n=1 Tax=Ilex paraguariensis TaxID=185542 RepID=A0ABC8T7M2_9AQUA